MQKSLIEFFLLQRQKLPANLFRIILESKSQQIQAEQKTPYENDNLVANKQKACPYSKFTAFSFI